MKTWLDWIKVALAAVGGFIVAALGGWDALLEVLIALVVLDYVTGVMEAYQNKTLNSSVGLRGIFKKAGYFIAVIAAVELDKILVQAAGGSGWLDTIAQALPARSVMIMFLVANEGLSLFEHLAALGVPIPRFILDALEKLKETGETGEYGGGEG